MSTQFEVGQTYSTRSACDYDCVFSWVVVARTSKTVWLESHGRVNKRSVKEFDGVEWCRPSGSYSMAPVISADRKDA